MNRAQHYRRLSDCSTRPISVRPVGKSLLIAVLVHAILATAEAHVAVAAFEDT